MCYKSMMRLRVSGYSHTILLLQRKPCAGGIWGGGSEVVHVMFWYSINVDFVPIAIQEVCDFPGIWLRLPSVSGN